MWYENLCKCANVLCGPDFNSLKNATLGLPDHIKLFVYPEDRLHPNRIRERVNEIARLAEESGDTVLFVTLSPVVLDCFKYEDHHLVWVVTPNGVQNYTDIAHRDYRASISAGSAFDYGEI